jgi:vancomycin resistance protein YoaR
MPELFDTPSSWRFTAPLSVLVGIAAVLIATTIGFQSAYADRIAAGVHVMGVELGGRTRADARGILAAESAELLRQPITLQAQGEKWHATPRELGMGMDVDAMVEEAFSIGRTGNPIQRASTQWGSLFFGQRFEGSVPQFDNAQLESELRKLASQIDRPVQDAHIQLVPSGDRVLVTIAREETGVQVLIPESVQRVRQALIQSIPTTVDLVVDLQEPGAATSDFQEAKAQADRMLASPLVLTFEEKKWTVAPPDVAKMLAFEREPGHAAQVVVNPAAMNSTLERIVREVQQPSVDARFDWAGGAMRVIRESQDGRTLDIEALRNQLRERLLAGETTVTLPVAVSRPTVASSDGARLGIRELIREGRTAFAGSVAEKQHNIRLAASRLNGVVVMPGALFSFNREVGPTTLDNGYQTGWGITGTGQGARTVPSVAGGICQVATTLFQPVFQAGYLLEERHWHLYWIPSYGQPPAGMTGLDATVDEDSGLDFKFINNTDNPLLVHARVEGSSLIFGLYGTKPSWTVKVEGPSITDVVAADRTPVEQDEPTIPAGRRLAVESAQDGFVSTIVRTVTVGSDVRTLRLRSNYVPSRNVTLIGTGRT